MSQQENTSISMDINEIMRYLPHRYPFLLIDRVLEVIPGERILAIKNVTYNEPFFTGHFPIRPVMPGVMILEALAQTTGLLGFKTANVDPDIDESLYFLVGIDKARFKKIVEPGDQLRMEVTFNKAKAGIWMFQGTATVDGKVACSAEIMCTRKDANA